MRCRRWCSGPYWYVPTSIKVDEIRPYLREEASWFFRSSPVEPRCSSVTGLGVRYAGRDVDPIRLTGTASISAISNSTSRPDPTTCSAE